MASDGQATGLATVTTVRALRARVAAWRAQGCKVGFVPTMGNLHEGHMSLIEKAHESASRIVASIFVNPLQFGPDEDYQVYPRTLEADGAMLAAAGVHLLFAPPVAEMYPDGEEAATRVVVPQLSETLCGAHRPGHFGGMATVVTKLLNMVTADVAVFGEKDYQQLMIIRRLARDLWIPVEIIPAPTYREDDGLAMSSRNRYLTAAQRVTAAVLYETLRWAVARIEAGCSDYSSLQAEALRRLGDAGFEPNYFEVRDASDLEPPGPATARLRVLAAAWLGNARLIDNLPVAAPAVRGQHEP